MNAAAARASIMIAIVMAPSAAVSAECRLVFGDDQVEIPAERLDADSRCRLAEILEHPDVSSVLGPDRTPIAAAFYVYLLDRPPLVAGLLAREPSLASIDKELAAESLLATGEHAARLLITRPDQLRPAADIATTHTPPAVTAALALTD